MPFGLTNGPATFQIMINAVLRPFLDRFVVIYLDDILVSFNTTTEHFNHVKQVLKPMSEHNLDVKGEKCEFDVDTVEFLGNIISSVGMT